MCWYNTETGEIKDYVKNDDGSVQKPEGNYVIAAKPGGLRSGDMSAGIGTKYADSDASISANATETADTYYLPTVSSSSGYNESGDDSSSNKIIINLYMGNNGRIAVSNTQLLVTKTVDAIGADLNNLNNNDKTYKYTINLKGQTEPLEAIKATREADRTWRALIKSITLTTNNQGMLLDNSGSLATVYVYLDANGNIADTDGNIVYSEGKIVDPDKIIENKDGNFVIVVDSDKITKDSDENIIVPDGCTVKNVSAYNIFVEDATESGNNYTLFDSTDPTRGDSFHGILGSGKTLTIVASLVPVNGDSSKKMKSFPVGHVGFDSDTQIGFAVKTNYQSNTTYQTETLYFDNTGKAEFYLKDGEGLLFTGLKSGAKYTVTEYLSDDQVEDGIFLKSVTHIENDGDKKNTKVYYGSANSKSGDNYNFDNTHHTYSVFGETNTIFTEEVDYFNFLTYTEKTELEYGEDGYAKVGDILTYDIYWENYATDESEKYVDATVTVRDPLDNGVDFVNASFGSVTLNADADTPNKSVDIEGDNIKISYLNPDTPHTVTWVIKKVAPLTEGVVTLKVKVNENAEKGWSYEDDSINGKYDEDEQLDYKVFNRASVKVDNDNARITETIENPLSSSPTPDPKVPLPELPATGGKETTGLLLLFGGNLVFIGLVLLFVSHSKKKYLLSYNL